MPLAGAACAGCAVCSVAVVILVPDAVPQRLKPPSMRDAYGTTEVVPFPVALARLKPRPFKTQPRRETQPRRGCDTKSLLRYRRLNRLRALLLLLPVADRGA